MSKKIFIVLGFLISLLLSLTSWPASTKNEIPKLDNLTVMLDWFPNPNHAPLFVADQQGFFKQQGLSVKLIGPADPADPPKLVAAGKVDIAITYQPQLIMQVSAGLPLVRIATLIATPLNCLVIKANSEIHTIADLKGKTIGISTDGIDTAALKAMLEKHGLSLQDINLVDVHYALTQALLAGKVDAVIGMMRNFELIQMRLAGQPGRAFYPEENEVPPYDELVLVVNKNKLNDPRLSRFLTALTQGVQYLVNYPQQSWEIFAKNHPELNNELNRQAWFATLPRFSLSPAALDHYRYENFSHFLLQQKLIKTIPPLNSYAVELPH